jgi:ribonuclease T2
MKRRTGSIAAILGGAIAALMLSWLGLGPQQKVPAPHKNQTTQSPTLSTKDAQEPFDFYQLALSLAPAFCEVEPEHSQCRTLNPEADARTPLTLHGLWPEYRGAGRFPSDCADSWDGEGFARAESPSERERLMPGGTRLARHEWQKHGSCSHASVESYFRDSFALAETYGDYLAPLVNKLKRDADLISTTKFRSQANQLQSGLGASLTFVCKNLRGVAGERRGKPHLLEVRVCLEKTESGIGKPIECASVDRIDQGCGRAFYVDAP